MIKLIEIGRLPAAGDNCAIAIRTLPAGTAVQDASTTFTLSHTILEGHRFAIRPIHIGEELLSWGFPFGAALTEIAPGEYICNQAVLDELNGRSLDFPLPASPNFTDQAATYTFDASRFQPAPPVPQYSEQRTFMGYPRPGRNGAGTRNMIVLLGTSSLTAAFVRQLEEKLRPLAAEYDNIDDIVAVAHTEGGGRIANNRDLLLRTLAGFMTHPNVGAVLAVDNGDEAVTNAMLQAFMLKNGYPLDSIPHHFLSRDASFSADLESAAAIVENWLKQVNAVERTAVPLSQLKIALQCGGSDAFSGISGNPLASWLAKEALHNGGSANLAETDELVGAERYMMAKVGDRETAERFLQTIDRFQGWAARHGHSAAGNPSGGNLYRGLYNIYLKSIGAATKRNPDVPLAHVIDYAAPMMESGFHFMDSPGNDLESIAGQVASGCNLILFVTGNGSITNFPFVPTIKIVTTSERYALLSEDMDINAGQYLDGTPLETLGQQSFEYMTAVISGKAAAGERARHAQVQIWRDWHLTETAESMPLTPISQEDINGRPYSIEPIDNIPSVQWTAVQTRYGTTANPVGLILPTSLCAGQIARMCAHRLNEQGFEKDRVSSFVALPHTEGCGASTQVEFVDTILGYATHPMVASCLLLEHGCE
ncbi:MAG: UxaA family hydrolase, partial [Candidatus Promineifilaceae bacterium]